MAYGKSLELQKIQPKDRPAGDPQPNMWRRLCKQQAKHLNVSTRRMKRALRKAEHAQKIAT